MTLPGHSERGADSGAVNARQDNEILAAAVCGVPAVTAAVWGNTSSDSGSVGKYQQWQRQCGEIPAVAAAVWGNTSNGVAHERNVPYKYSAVSAQRAEPDISTATEAHER